MKLFDVQSKCSLGLVLLCAALALSGGSATAQETKKSTVKGAGIGALLGQAIGHDTESTVIGGVIGAGVGRIVGKEKEKEKAEAAQSAPPAATTAPPKATTLPAPAPEPDPALALPNTIWKLDSLQPKDRVPAFFSKVITFRPDNYVQTLTTDPEGNVTLSEESYSAVGNTIVVNKPEYTIQARFKVDGDQLIISAEDFSAILKRIKPE